MTSIFVRVISISAGMKSTSEKWHLFIWIYFGQPHPGLYLLMGIVPRTGQGLVKGKPSGLILILLIALKGPLASNSKISTSLFVSMAFQDSGFYCLIPEFFKK
jgi:hypothetical protein